MRSGGHASVLHGTVCAADPRPSLVLHSCPGLSVAASQRACPCLPRQTRDATANTKRGGDVRTDVPNSKENAREWAARGAGRRGRTPGRARGGEQGASTAAEKAWQPRAT
jgi:hypothetical protein